MAEEKKVNNAAPAKAAVAVKKDDTKPGFFARAGKWFREMKSELKKVIWPTPQVLAKNTGISVAVMVVSAAAALAVPVMLGASLLKIVKFGFAFTGTQLAVLLLGMAVAFAVSIIAIKFLIGYIKKHDFKVFGYYRIGLGLLIFLLLILKVL